MLGIVPAAGIDHKNPFIGCLFHLKVDVASNGITINIRSQGFCHHNVFHQILVKQVQSHSSSQVGVRRRNALTVYGKGIVLGGKTPDLDQFAFSLVVANGYTRYPGYCFRCISVRKKQELFGRNDIFYVWRVLLLVQRFCLSACQLTVNSDTAQFCCRFL